MPFGVGKVLFRVTIILYPDASADIGTRGK